MSLQDEKSGKRVRKSMIALLNEAIGSLLSVVNWARYEDALPEEEVSETDEKGLAPRLPIATLGDLNRPSAQPTPRRSGGGGGGRPNWSAKVGQIIIGNLMRGEGGRFASARNIAKMMNLLDDNGITPDMFTGMQSLLAGASTALPGSVMANLRSAGLVNDQGIVQAKANEIINAIKTGDPANLRVVLKPTGGGGGGGGGGGSSGPTKEEKQ